MFDTDCQEKSLDNLSREIINVFISSGLTSTISDEEGYYKSIHELVKDIDYDIITAKRGFFYANGVTNYQILPISVEYCDSAINIFVASDKLKMDSSKIIYSLFFSRDTPSIILLFDNKKQVSITLQNTDFISFKEENSIFDVIIDYHPTYAEFLRRLLDVFPEDVLEAFNNFKDNQCGLWNGIEILFLSLMEWEKLNDYKVNYSTALRIIMGIYHEFSTPQNWLDFVDMILLATEIHIDNMDN